MAQKIIHVVKNISGRKTYSSDLAAVGVSGESCNTKEKKSNSANVGHCKEKRLTALRQMALYMQDLQCRWYVFWWCETRQQTYRLEVRGNKTIRTLGRRFCIKNAHKNTRCHVIKCKCDNN